MKNSQSQLARVMGKNKTAKTVCPKKKKKKKKRALSVKKGQ